MIGVLSANTQAILLLTAPLITGNESSCPHLLSLGEYQRLAYRLRQLGRTPADLVAAGADALIADCESVVQASILRELLGRGFQLAQAVEAWHARGIWVISRADEFYPRRVKVRLQENSPPVLYGCGEISLLASGGLAVIGSKGASERMIAWAEEVGRLAAKAGVTVVSSGADGVDEASVRGALAEGGLACVILTDSFDKQAIRRSHRPSLINKQLVLVSPYDPSTHRRVDHPIERIKLISALADGGLVVDAAINSSETESGEIEQLRTYRWRPLWVRQADDGADRRTELLKRGALAWPEPTSPDALRLLLNTDIHQPHPTTTLFPAMDKEAIADAIPIAAETVTPLGRLPLSDHQQIEIDALPSSADQLYDAARAIIHEILSRPCTGAELAFALGVPKSLANTWLNRMLDEGLVTKDKRPVRYRRSVDNENLPIAFPSDTPGRPG